LVVYYANQLTIVADNSSLKDILTAIREQTGAEIEIPPNAESERVAARLGPAPARKVLTNLLSQTTFDYAIQAPADDNQGIQRVLLTARQKSGAVFLAGGATAAELSKRGSRSPSEPDSPPAGTGSPEDAQQAAVTQSSPPKPQLTAAQEQSGDGQSTSGPAEPNGENLQAAATELPAPMPVSEAGPTQAQTRSEQMMGELQRMYQQRMQMQEQARRSAGTN
jgi:hypothetical protein